MSSPKPRLERPKTRIVGRCCMTPSHSNARALRTCPGCAAGAERATKLVSVGAARPSPPRQAPSAAPCARRQRWPTSGRLRPRGSKTSSSRQARERGLGKEPGKPARGEKAGTIGIDFAGPCARLPELRYLRSAVSSQGSDMRDLSIDGSCRCGPGSVGVSITPRSSPTWRPGRRYRPGQALVFWSTPQPSGFGSGTCHAVCFAARGCSAGVRERGAGTVQPGSLQSRRGSETETRWPPAAWRERPSARWCRAGRLRQ